MAGQQHSGANTLEHDDGIRAEDMFRRAAFRWAQSTKLLVESSTALGLNTKVAHAALEDIEYARDLLVDLFMPKASKVPAAFADRPNPLSAGEVRACVSDLAKRVITIPVCVVDECVTPTSPPVRAPRTPQQHRGSDLSAPVYSKNGKMLWANIDCPMCPAKATQRCQKDDGGPLEKPHPQRKVEAETVASVTII